MHKRALSPLGRRRPARARATSPAPARAARVPPEPLGDPADRPAGLDEAEQGATLIEVELAVGPGQGRLRRANPCKGWGFALRDRTHRAAAAGRGGWTPCATSWRARQA